MDDDPFVNEELAWEPGEEIGVTEYNEEHDFDEEALAVATREHIFYLDPEEDEKRKIVERPAKVNDLVFHDGELYDGGDYELVQTSFLSAGEHVTLECDSPVTALASDGDTLYHAGGERVSVLHIDEMRDEEIFSAPGQQFTALAIDGETLYYALPDQYRQGQIFCGTIGDPDSFHKLGVGRGNQVNDLAVQRGTVYDTGDYASVMETENDNKLTVAKSRIRALESYQDELVYGWGNGVKKVSDGKTLWAFDHTVTAITTMPKELGDRLRDETESNTPSGGFVIEG